jgi:hypothetical protein
MSRAIGHPARRAGLSPAAKVGIIVGAVAGVCLIGLVLVWRYLIAPDLGDPETRSPGNVAEAYLLALATLDSVHATALSWDTPDERAFLTGDVLASSMAAHPLTGITVVDEVADGDVGYAIVSYRLGSELVQARFDASRRDGLWRLDHPTATVELPILTRGVAGFSLAGVILDGRERIEVFPGVYELTLDNAYVELSNGSITVAGTGETVTADGPELSLKDSVQSSLLSLARTRFNACLAEQAFKPSEGCGFGYDRTEDGAVIETFDWTVTSGSLDGAHFTLNPDDPTVATAAISVSLHGEGLSTAGGRYRGDQTLVEIKVELFAEGGPAVSFSHG